MKGRDETLASGVVLANPNVNDVVGAAKQFGDSKDVRLQVDASAITGTTPSLTLQPQSSIDGANWFAEGTAFTAITAAGSQQKDIADFKGALLRVIVSAKAGTTPGATVTIRAFSKAP